MPPDQNTIDLTVVVPFYNPGTRLRTTVEALVASLHETDLAFEILAVSDGSTDGSAGTLDDTDPTHVRCIELPINHGKGEALRTGMAQGRGRHIAFIDADGDLPPQQLSRAVLLARDDQVDVVVGSKNHAESDIHSTLVRRLLSTLWQGFVSLLFHLDVSDTQTGLKVMRREVVQRCLPLTRETGFAFDLELLVVARKLGFTRMVEFPVELVERAGSTVKLKTALAMVPEALAIFGRCYVLRSYKGAPQSTASNNA